MRNRIAQSFLLIIAGVIIIGAGFFIYLFAHTVFPESSSSRVRDLNWLLSTFGKTGTATIIASIGLVPLYFGIKKLINK